MRNCLTIEELENTPTYRDLIAKKELAQASVLRTRIERAKITNAFFVYRNTGEIPSTVRSNGRLVTLDLIAMGNTDASAIMNCETVKLMTDE